MSWKQVRGHDHLIDAFHRAADRSRLGHAFLFVGPLGVGKRTFARQLARTLLCENRPTDRWDSCDTCPACLLISAGTHPDLFEIARPDDALEFPIQTMRELCESLSLKPARARNKVAIIDDADDLNEESANCFLKTLEEPPSGSLLFLIGTSLDRQLPTIRSRCQVVSFGPLSTTLVEDVLRSSSDSESDAVTHLARIAAGSPGMALALDEPQIWEFRNKLLDSLARGNPDTLALAKEWQELIEAAGKEPGQQRRRAALMIRLLMDAFRLALSPTELADGPDAYRIRALAEKFGEDGLLRRIDRCLEAANQNEQRVQLVLLLEALMDALP